MTDMNKKSPATISPLGLAAILVCGVVLFTWTIFGDPFQVEDQKAAERVSIQACVDAGGQWVRGDCYTPSQ